MLNPIHFNVGHQMFPGFRSQFFPRSENERFPGFPRYKGTGGSSGGSRRSSNPFLNFWFEREK